MASEEIFPLSGRRVWVAGHNGMVGSALVRRLASEGCQILSASKAELDLTRQAETEAWIAKNRPEAIFVAAAKVGGILANSTAPADFIYNNLIIEANVLQAAADHGVAKLLFLGSSCIYPRDAAQPMAEEALLTGPLEPTNEAYAIAKIAGIKFAGALRSQYGCDFISAMPTNLYGPGDNYDLNTSHVLPAMIRKAHEAKLASADRLTIWGTGTPRREFLHVDDCADALVHMMKVYSDAGHINIGCGDDIAILDLAKLVAEVVGFEGQVETDPSKPDGMPRKLLDVGRLATLGWRSRIGLRDGVAATYAAWLEKV
ncbi:MAG: GDP-L-fucose synthase [Caulobacteraceae bacterium]